MNLLLIVSDTFRWDYLGAYGNHWISTPHLDALAEESAIYDDAFAEGMPTVPARRVIFTGRPIFPWELRPMKSDPVRLYGWHSLWEEDVTLAEHLREQDYITCFVNDCYHMMKPGKNFHRGFDCWHWIRGQEGDMYHPPDREQVAESLARAMGDRPVRPRSWVTQYLMNRLRWQSEEDTHVAQVMRTAADWVRDYRMANPFYLHVECFDPHEPWDPPVEYARQYKPDYDGLDGVIPPDRTDRLSEEQMANVKAAYAGKVSLVDRWVGHLLATLKETGRMDDTVVVFTSDHGTMMGEQGELHKRHDRLRNQVWQVPLLIRHPSGEHAGEHIKGFVQHMDIMPTALGMVGVSSPERVLGRDVWPGTADADGTPEQIIGAFGPWACIRTKKWSLVCPWGRVPGAETMRTDLYDLESDPEELCNVIDQRPDVAQELRERLDAHMREHAPLTVGTTDVGSSADANMSLDCRLPV